ncbi:hypothetical protein ACTXT7_009127 [Hymenolepis weldensis]
MCIPHLARGKRAIASLYAPFNDPTVLFRSSVMFQVSPIVNIACIGSFAPANYAAASLVNTILAQMPVAMDQQSKLACHGSPAHQQNLTFTSG